MFDTPKRLKRKKTLQDRQREASLSRSKKHRSTPRGKNNKVE